MAFFKFRKGGGDESQSPRAQPESIEAMRTRARHRLIGAGVLVLLGVLGFPLLFDTQPRPIAVDIPIEIPDRAKARPLPMPPQSAQAPVASGSVSGAVSGAVNPAASETRPAPVVEAPKVAKVEAKPEPKPEAKPEPVKAEAQAQPKAEPKPEPKVAAKPDDGARAKALLEGKAAQQADAAAQASGAEGRFVVQVGAFADAAKAKEARARVEKAGLKTYTQIADTKDGKRTRVRVGPFGSRAEADKAAEKIKGLDLPAAILTL